jgi:integrase
MTTASMKFPMNLTRCKVPSDDEVRRLLRASVTTGDARSAAAVTILLSLGLRLSVVRQLRWSYVRQKGTQLQTRSKRYSDEIVPITRLLSRQLLAIGPKGTLERIFAKPSPESLSLDALFSAILVRTGLPGYHWNDFVEWSGRQSMTTKLQVATLWNELGCP